MFTVECAFRLRPSGVEFRLDDDPPEDEMCELRVNFRFYQFHAPERDVGAGLTWDSNLEKIEFRAPGEPWRELYQFPYNAARAFLKIHCREALDEAEREAALETYYGS